MKIIDHTSFYNNETGEISFFDRIKAITKYGSNWIKEAEAQKQIITVLGSALNRNYTLLRNVSPPGLDADFPFILVGPTGVYVMYVTPLTGIFRAKGDQWGTISGNTFKNEKPNLLTRTETMARAIQVFLQRQGYTMITTVEAILLCSDPSVHVDSIRPIIRVVMRDALERFAINITQSRDILSPEAVQDIIQRILTPPKPPEPQPDETQETPVPEERFPAQSEDPYPSAFVLPESRTSPESDELAPISFNGMQSLSLNDEQAPLPLSGLPTELNNEPFPLPVEPSQVPSKNPRKQALDKKQWIFLIGIFVIWILLMAVFLYLVISDQWSLISSLLP